MERKKIGLILPIVITLFFMIVLLVIENSGLELVLMNPQLHIYLESVGAFSILLVSYLLFSDQKRFDFNPSGIITGLWLMGILDTFHGFSDPGKSFVFLHDMAVLFGSMGFIAFVIINGRHRDFVLTGPVFIGLTLMGGAVGTASFVWVEYLPPMLVEGRFTPVAVGINLLSGIMFLLASGYLMKLYLDGPNKVKLLLIITALLQGVGSITFSYSELWCTTWWIWHFLRFMGNFLLIIFIFIVAEERQRIVSRQNREIRDINSKLNNYTYTISHDLKEPIRSIRTFSEFILEDYGEKFDETGKDYFERIIIASNKMAVMIDDLLVLSRIGRHDVKYERISLDEIVDEVVESLELVIKENDAVISHSDLPIVYCQVSWMKLVFSNMITNSIKYQDREMGIPRIAISCSEEKDEYEIAIQDNGIGLEEDQFDKIFGLFRRAYSKKDKTGSGAGLAIVKDIIGQHNGKVYVKESNPGKGTVFAFTIPKGVIEHE